MNTDPTRLLLIEDDPNDVELIHLALESYNFIKHIDVVMDGEQALNYLGLRDQADMSSSRILPRLILLDLKLPKIEGLDVLRAIRSNSQTKELVVVVLTSSAENQDLRACHNLGVNSYIVKPLDFQQFVDVTRKIGFYWMLLNQLPS